MTTITNKMVRDIRRSRAVEPVSKIARRLGINPATVWKYSSEDNLAKTHARERRHYERILEDPERLERRRQTSREKMRQLREKEKMR